MSYLKINPVVRRCVVGMYTSTLTRPDWSQHVKRVLTGFNFSLGSLDENLNVWAKTVDTFWLRSLVSLISTYQESLGTFKM
jgi:hypothetical protein